MALTRSTKPFSASRPDFKITACASDLGTGQAAQSGTERHAPTPSKSHGSNTELEQAVAREGGS